MFFLRFFLFVFLVLPPVIAPAAETILSFTSDIQVEADGAMTVRETIQVRAEGRQIRRGIFRDFPTIYTDRLGSRHHVPFEVLAVTRNGRTEPFHTQKRKNGVRVYMGQKNINITHGIHTYTLTFRTGRQIGFFDDHDELYWNVTGNGWAFVIEKAEATVTLPMPLYDNDVRLTAYTGTQGSHEQAFTGGVTPEGGVKINTTRSLAPKEGLTIVVGWPKGIIAEPSTTDKAAQRVADNKPMALALLGIIIVCGFYLFVWHRSGRDPEKGTVIPLFTPPTGLSPAAVHYVINMGFSERAFTSAIINLAIKGHITIEQKGKKYILHLTEGNDQKKLSQGETRVKNRLFSGKIKQLELDQKHHSRFSEAKEVLKESLAGEYNISHFRTNKTLAVTGTILSFLVLVAVGLTSAREVFPFLFLTLWLSVWTTAVVSMWAGRKYFMAVVFSMFEVGAIIAFIELASPWIALLLIILAGMNVLFFHLLKAPTLRGRAIMDQIDGFTMYLETAEEHRLNMLHPPEKTPELFEKYLPYALALDVEQKWGEKFTRVLMRAGDTPYQPGWYSGSSWSVTRPGSFSSNLGSSMSSAIASAATAPGSSSGFSGGGSSGGGGGGGGGGGW